MAHTQVVMMYGDVAYANMKLLFLSDDVSAMKIDKE
jgi:hypothetical protein